MYLTSAIIYLLTGVLVRPLDGAGLPVGPVHRVPEHRQGVGLRTLLHHRLHDRSATAASANTRLQEVILTSFPHYWSARVYNLHCTNSVELDCPEKIWDI